MWRVAFPLHHWSLCSSVGIDQKIFEPRCDLSLLWWMMMKCDQDCEAHPSVGWIYIQGVLENPNFHPVQMECTYIKILRRMRSATHDGKSSVNLNVLLVQVLPSGDHITVLVPYLYRIWIVWTDTETRLKQLCLIYIYPLSCSCGMSYQILNPRSN